MDRTRMSWLTTAILVGVAALFLVMAASPDGSASTGHASAFEATPLERPPSTAMLSAEPVQDVPAAPATSLATTTSLVVIVEDDEGVAPTSEAPPATGRPRRSTSRSTARGSRSASPTSTTTAAPAAVAASPGPAPAPSTTTSTTAANRGPSISGASLSRQWIHEQCATTSRPTTLTIQARVEDPDAVSSIAARLSSGPVRQVSMGSGNGQASATVGGYSPATVGAGEWITTTISIEAVDGRGARSRTQVGTITIYDNPDCS